MSPKWRIGLVSVELVILGLGSYLAVDEIVPREVWFASGLLAVVLQPLLQEVHYTVPYDVVANSVVAGLLVAWSDKDTIGPGWMALLVFLVIVGVLAVVALVSGATRRDPPSFARTASTLSSLATARVIYSSVFWLSLMESFPVGSKAFWVLGVTWAVVILIGKVPWQQVWSSVTNAPEPARVEGLIGPTTLLVSAGDLPSPGYRVQIRGSGLTVEALVLARIRRARDTWGQLYVADLIQAEALLQTRSVTLAESDEDDSRTVGSVGAGSSERSVVFTPTSALEVGDVVAVQSEDHGVIYQLDSATVEEMKVPGGSHLVVSSRANQVGWFDPATGRLTEHRWSPEPGAAVVATIPPVHSNHVPSEASLRLGSVIGTTIPVYLDLDLASQGHIVILGMTRMGKTTLALRLAHTLSKKRWVVILDQTGEYQSKLHVAEHVLGEWAPGCSVCEPPQGAVGPDFAQKFIMQATELAATEYAAGPPAPRSIMLEEAHQFVPEPTGLGFKAPGHDSAYQLGVDIMQLRKYGISMTLISQRTAVVAKSALSQCETMIAFRTVDQTSLDYLDHFAGGGVKRILPTLRQGQALVVGAAVSSDRPVAIDVDPLEETSSGQPTIALT